MHLDFLSEHEKAVFKTAFELDQRVIIDLAAERQPYISQGQSLNIFLPSNTEKRTLHDIHWRAWQKGVKGQYYLRSKTLQRAESSQTRGNRQDLSDQPVLPIRTDECLSCQ